MTQVSIGSGIAQASKPPVQFDAKTGRNVAWKIPLPGVARRLAKIEGELVDGRGFVLLRGLPRERYSQAELELIYWGLGMHLGEPWPQNAKGHVLGLRDLCIGKRSISLGASFPQP